MHTARSDSENKTCKSNVEYNDTIVEKHHNWYHTQPTLAKLEIGPPGQNLNQLFTSQFT